MNKEQAIQRLKDLTGENFTVSKSSEYFKRLEFYVYECEHGYAEITHTEVRSKPDNYIKNIVTVLHGVPGSNNWFTTNVLINTRLINTERV